MQPQPRLFGIPVALLQTQLKSLALIAMTYLGTRHPMTEVVIEHVVALIGAVATMTADYASAKGTAPPPPQAAHMNGAQPGSMAHERL